MALSGPLSSRFPGSGGTPYTPPAIALADGLVSYYDSGGTDRVGSNHLTAVNAPGTAVGKVSALCMDFVSASNQYYQLASASAGDFDPNRDITISFWYFLDSHGGVTSGIFSKDTGSPNYFRASGNQFRTTSLQAKSANGGLGVSGVTAWHLITMNWQNSAGILRRSFDGASIANIGSTPLMPANAADFYLGAVGGASPAWMMIDQFCVWHRNLSDDEISLLYNTGVGYDFLNA